MFLNLRAVRPCCCSFISSVSTYSGFCIVFVPTLVCARVSRLWFTHSSPLIASQFALFFNFDHVLSPYVLLIKSSRTVFLIASYFVLATSVSVFLCSSLHIICRPSTTFIHDNVKPLPTSPMICACILCCQIVQKKNNPFYFCVPTCCSSLTATAHTSGYICLSFKLVEKAAGPDGDDCLTEMRVYQLARQEKISLQSPRSPSSMRRDLICRCCATDHRSQCSSQFKNSCFLGRVPEQGDIALGRPSRDQPEHGHAQKR